MSSGIQVCVYKVAAHRGFHALLATCIGRKRIQQQSGAKFGIK